MTSNSMWPVTIVTADGDIIEGNGALCLECDEPLEDHICPDHMPTPDQGKKIGGFTLLNSTREIVPNGHAPYEE